MVAGPNVTRLATLPAQSVWFVLAVMPVALALANRSSAAVVTIAAVVALVAGLQLRGLDALVGRARSACSRPFGCLFLAFAGLAVASMGWSWDPARGSFALAEAFIPALAVIVVALALGDERPSPRAVWLLAICMALAAVEVFFELYTRLAWRQALGLRTAPFTTNKPVIVLVLLIWPLVALTAGMARRVAILVVVGVACTLTVFKSVSGAAMCALVTSAVAFAVASLAPRVGRILLMVGLAASLLIAPFKGELAARLIPARALDAAQSLHARDRVDIWRSFGDLVSVRPALGTGFGASAVVGRDPVAQQVPVDRRTMLDVGHPHDMFLQVWVELGLAGALLAAVGLALLWRLLAGLDPVRHAPAVALVTATWTIALVGHGAWQGWWIAALGAAILWLRAAPAAGAATTTRESA